MSTLGRGTQIHISPITTCIKKVIIIKINNKPQPNLLLILIYMLTSNYIMHYTFLYLPLGQSKSNAQTFIYNLKVCNLTVFILV